MERHNGQRLCTLCGWIKFHLTAPKNKIVESREGSERETSQVFGAQYIHIYF